MTLHIHKPAEPETIYPCTIDSDIDGDTVHTELTETLQSNLLPRGLKIIVPIKLRLAGINTPELKNPDGTPNPAGLQSQDFTIQWFVNHAGPYTATVKGRGQDKYSDRIDGRLIAADGHCLNDDLLHSGNAVVMK